MQKNQQTYRNAEKFFIMTFAISWFFWGVLPQMANLPDSVILMAGTFGPTLSALILTISDNGLKGLRALFGKLLIWKFPAKWYLGSLFGPALVVAVSLGIHKFVGGTVTQLNDPRQWYLIFPAFFQILFFSVAGEELGWRGYALPKLQSRTTSLKASIIIGFAWGIWHLPLWAMPGNFHNEIPLVPFILHDVALSILMTWMYNCTRKSLLLPHLFHTAINLTIGVSPILPEGTGGSLIPLAITFLLLWLVTIIVVFKAGPTLGRRLNQVN